MNKTVKYTLSLLCGLAAVSCNLNDHPTFDDKDAFVAFDKSTMIVKESADTISIPVTLASVSGIATTISYEYVAEPDSTVIPKSIRAKLDSNFVLVDGAGTLTFSAEARTQYIKVKIINKPGIYTGDLKFQLRIKNSGSVKTSAEDNIVVTIADNDHPLASILGTYTCSGVSYFDGDVKWDMTFEKDPSDITVVWITGIASGFTSGGFYGVVTMDGATPVSIKIPLGQINAEHQTTTGDGNIYLYGLDSEGESLSDEGNIVVTIFNDGENIKFDDEWGPSVNQGGTSYYFDLMFPGIEGTKTK